MKSRLLLILITALAIALTLYFNLSDQALSDEVKPEVGFKAPNFSLAELHTGELYSLETSGKPVVLNFWASWCGPCEAEMPDLIQMYEKYKDEVEVYGINVTVSDIVQNAEKFVENFAVPYPILMDTENDAGKKYKILAMPTTFFIQADGTIVHKANFMDASAMEAAFQKLVKK